MRPEPEHLRCPDCGHDGLRWPAGADALDCAGCATEWSVVDGLPKLYRDAALGRVDRMMRRIYDGLPSLHDPLVRVALPLLQGRHENEHAVREAALDRLRLDGLAAPADRPLRVLEVGVGTGANLPRLRARLPAAPVEVWGLDYSIGMLRRCRRRCRRHPSLGQTRLLLGDAHALPFADHFFDRVFHIGAINGFEDPAAALAEMARVARPGTPIVVVDERLDPSRDTGLLRRLGFRAVTFYDPAPACPRDAVPAGAADVRDEQISRCFYCLSFRTPG
ncbi:MAG: methyltransferase domain-containing protein [Myxococcales bacterium]|nr:methyltransferase domain-containing protein [Myxococcales bacterium]